MSGSPREQSGLPFNASDTTVVTITGLGMYARNKSASLHVVLWGMQLHCSLLRGRVKQNAAPWSIPSSNTIFQCHCVHTDL